MAGGAYRNGSTYVYYVHRLYDILTNISSEIALSWWSATAAEEFCDPFPSENLVLVVVPGDPGYFAVVPPVLVSRRQKGSRSLRFGQRGSSSRLKAGSLINREPAINLRRNTCYRVGEIAAA
jgi:hypothetical protein